MNSSSLVSILTTVYNREKYLESCIESILHSTYTNWELRIVDDGSTDASVEIAKRYANLDKRIKLYVNKQNIGDYANRNKAASHAKGKYLKYLDADDIIYPHSLQVMIDAMEANPDSAFGLSYNVIDDFEPYPHEISSKEAIISFLTGKNVLGVGPSASIIRRDRFEEVGGFSGKQYIGDVELWTKFASKWPVVKLQPSLIWWRQHDDQQIVFERKNYSVAAKRYLHKIEVSRQSKRLLSKCDIDFAIRYNRFRQSRLILNVFFRKRDIRNALLLKRESQISTIQLLGSIKFFLG